MAKNRWKNKIERKKIFQIKYHISKVKIRQVLTIIKIFKREFKMKKIVKKILKLESSFRL